MRYIIYKIINFLFFKFTLYLFLSYSKILFYYTFYKRVYNILHRLGKLIIINSISDYKFFLRFLIVSIRKIYFFLIYYKIFNIVSIFFFIYKLSKMDEEEIKKNLDLYIFIAVILVNSFFN